MKIFLQRVLPLMTFLGLGHGVEAGDIGISVGGGGSVTSYVDGLYLGFEDALSYVLPGTSFVMDLDLEIVSPSPSLHSLVLPNVEEPFLTLTKVELLPPGWTFSLDAGSFSAVNADGEDLAGDLVHLAQFTYTVSEEASPGTRLTIPFISTPSLFDVNGNAINVIQSAGYISEYIPVGVPEPSSLACAGIALLLLTAANRTALRPRPMALS